MRKLFRGVTGFTSREQVLEVTKDMKIPANIEVEIGVLVSSKTMMGIPNRWTERYLTDRKALSSVFTDQKGLFNTFHYNTKIGPDGESLSEQLKRLMKLGGPYHHGTQLNIPWAPPCEIEKHKNQYPAKRIILQIGDRAFREVGGSPEKLAKKVKTEYEGIVDYILLDPSGGLGIPLKPEVMRTFVIALLEEDIDIGICFAGGLYTAVLPKLVKPLTDEFPGILSWDAEGKIRDKITDKLIISEANSFLTEGFNYQ